MKIVSWIVLFVFIIHHAQILLTKQNVIQLKLYQPCNYSNLQAWNAFSKKHPKMYIWFIYFKWLLRTALCNYSSVSLTIRMLFFSLRSAVRKNNNKILLWSGLEVSCSTFWQVRFKEKVESILVKKQSGLFINPGSKWIEFLQRDLG